MVEIEKVQSDTATAIWCVIMSAIALTIVRALWTLVPRARELFHKNPDCIEEGKAAALRLRGHG